MTEQRPRRWFQVHLSTACVLMLVAAGLVWANLKEHGPYVFDSVVYEYGWPVFWLSVDFVDDSKNWQWLGRPLFINLMVVSSILIMTVLTLEWSIKRRLPNSKNQKRRTLNVFYMHRSSIFALLISGSVMLWANLRAPRIELLERYESAYGQKYNLVAYTWYGWPFSALSGQFHCEDYAEPFVVLQKELSNSPFGQIYLANGILCLFIWLLSAFLSESLIRRARRSENAADIEGATSPGPGPEEGVQSHR